MADYRGYSAYKGRKQGNKGWLIVLLVVALLALAILLVLQQWTFYDASGRMYVQFPWASVEPSPTPEQEDFNVIRDDPQPTIQPSENPTEETPSEEQPTEEIPTEGEQSTENSENPQG